MDQTQKDVINYLLADNKIKSERITSLVEYNKRRNAIIEKLGKELERLRQVDLSGAEMITHSC